MANFNGHRSWAAWNVSLWIGNDEGLYSLAKDCIRGTRTREKAAARFLEAVTETGQTATPDGAKWTKTNILLAMRGM